MTAKRSFLSLLILTCGLIGHSYSSAGAVVLEDLELHESIGANDFDGVLKALNDHADPNARYRFSKEQGRPLTPLQRAAEVADPRIIRLLLERGAHLYPNGDSPLRLAVVAGRIDAARVMLEFGANPNFDRPQQLTYVAAQSHNHEFLRLLMEYSEDVTLTEEPLESEQPYEHLLIMSARQSSEILERFIQEHALGAPHYQAALSCLTVRGTIDNFKFLYAALLMLTETDAPFLQELFLRAARCGNCPVIQFLSDLRDVVFLQETLDRALAAASAQGHHPVVEFLITGRFLDAINIENAIDVLQPRTIDADQGVEITHINELNDDQQKCLVLLLRALESQRLQRQNLIAQTLRVARSEFVRAELTQIGVLELPEEIAGRIARIAHPVQGRFPSFILMSTTNSNIF